MRTKFVLINRGQRIFRVVEGGKKSIELDKPKSIAQLTVYVGSGGGDAA